MGLTRKTPPRLPQMAEHGLIDPEGAVVIESFGVPIGHRIVTLPVHSTICSSCGVDDAKYHCIRA